MTNDTMMTQKELINYLLSEFEEKTVTRTGDCNPKTIWSPKKHPIKDNEFFIDVKQDIKDFLHIFHLELHWQDWRCEMIVKLLNFIRDYNIESFTHIEDLKDVVYDYFYDSQNNIFAWYAEDQNNRAGYADDYMMSGDIDFNDTNIHHILKGGYMILVNEMFDNLIYYIRNNSIAMTEDDDYDDYDDGSA